MSEAFPSGNYLNFFESVYFLDFFNKFAVHSSTGFCNFFWNANLCNFLFQEFFFKDMSRELKGKFINELFSQFYKIKNPRFSSGVLQFNFQFLV